MSALHYCRLLLGLSLVIAVTLPVRADDSTAGRCPAYTGHLIKAKSFLAARDQSSALEELQRARDALSACIREEAEESSQGTRLASVFPPPVV